MFTIILIILGLILGSLLLSIWTENSIKKTIKKVLKEKGFNTSSLYLSISEGTKSFIAVNKEEDKIALVSYDEFKKTFSRRKRVSIRDIILYRDILGTEIKHDGQVITQTKRLSQVVGMVVGGVVLGGVGVIVGGLSGKTEQKNKQNIKHLELLIYVNDISNPIRKIDFLRTSSSMSFITKSVFEEALKWEKIIEILIKKADAQVENDKLDVNINTQRPLSVIEELEKLSHLKESQITTQDEFETLKRDLLNKDKENNV